VFTDDGVLISVCIIVKDEEMVRSTLNCLKNERSISDWECVVVDASYKVDSSLKREYAWVNWFEFPPVAGRRVTIPHQRNFAVLNAKGKWILFCDAGGVPSSDWISTLSKPLKSREFRLVGGPIININHWAPTVKQNFQSYGEKLEVSTSANMGFDRDLHTLLGGFNENLDYGSDADFIWRAEAIGVQHSAIPDAVMKLDGGSFSRECKRAWKYGSAVIDLFFLHPNKISDKLRHSPEIFLYPFLLIFAITSILGNLIGVIPSTIFLSIICIHILLIFKNFRSNRPFFSIFLNYIYAVSSIRRLISKVELRKNEI